MTILPVHGNSCPFVTRCLRAVFSTNDHRRRIINERPSRTVGIFRLALETMLGSGASPMYLTMVTLIPATLARRHWNCVTAKPRRAGRIAILTLGIPIS
jgi:hypothetical protein